MHLYFPFTGSIYTFKYSHRIEPEVEGQKVASHGHLAMVGLVEGFMLESKKVVHGGQDKR